MSGAPPPDADSIHRILEVLKGQNRPPSTTQTSAPPPTMAPYPGQIPPPYPPQLPYGAPPGYPPAPQGQPGGMDINAIRPVNTGSLSLGGDGIDKGRAYGTMSPYDGGRGGYPQHDRGDGRDYRRRSRSRSPPARRDAYRDNYNPYRDERREDRGPASRDYGHHGRTYSPDERGRGPSYRGGGGPRDRSAGRGDDNSETIQIDSSLVGLIIGRNGENLRRIEADTGCKVQFLNADGGPMRQCKIAGPRARRNEVKTAIDRIIGDTGMGGGGPGPGAGAGVGAGGVPRGGSHDRPREQRGGAASLREGEDHMQIMVPDPTVGLIIGRGGETIRDLQERSGCHINIVGENKSINGLRPVNLIGTLEAAQMAKDLIMEIVDSDSRGEGGAGGAAGGGGGGGASHGKKPMGNRPDGGHAPRDHNMGGGGGGMMGDKIHDSIRVPSEAVGMIIGKRGDTIREIQNQTGCKINVAQSSGEGEIEREIALIGSHDSIARAKQAIDEKVDAVRQKGGPGSNGGRDRPREHHGGYGQPSAGPPASAPAPSGQAAQPQQPTDPASDPYAAYGGYQAYLALWYQQYLNTSQNGAAGGAAGGQPQPPGGGQ